MTYYQTYVDEEGKSKRTIFGLIYSGMKQRCTEGRSVQKSRPTYVGCTYHEEWKDFQLFGKWCSENYIEGYQLDKDIKFPGNKHYSPETCIFVPVAINSFVASLSVNDDKSPLGTYYKVRDKRYYSQAHDLVTGKRKHLGCSVDLQKMYDLFVAYKLERVEELLKEYDNLPECVYTNVREMTYERLKASAEKHNLQLKI